MVWYVKVRIIEICKVLSPIGKKLMQTKNIRLPDYFIILCQPSHQAQPMRGHDSELGHDCRSFSSRVSRAHPRCSKCAKKRLGTRLVICYMLHIKVPAQAIFVLITVHNTLPQFDCFLC